MLELVGAPDLSQPVYGVTPMSDCLFCRIVRGEIPAAKVAETEACLAFRDIAPQAPVHVLVIPKRHYRRSRR